MRKEKKFQALKLDEGRGRSEIRFGMAELEFHSDAKQLDVTGRDRARRFYLSFVYIEICSY